MDTEKLWTFFRLSLVVFFMGLPVSEAADKIKPLEPGKQDTCPVCGMFVAPYPEWMAQVVFEDSSAAFFDGCKDMFKYLLDRDRFAPGKSHLKIAESFVTSYYEGEVIPARSAHFVVGSDVFGPMGPELVPHRTREEAEEFLRDHKGSKVVFFDEVTREILRTLNKLSQE